MRILLFLCVLIPAEVLAKAPECPLHENKKLCLESVEENYRKFLEFLDEEEAKEQLIEAANSTKHFESLACQKTCLY